MRVFQAIVVSMLFAVSLASCSAETKKFFYNEDIGMDVFKQPAKKPPTQVAKHQE